MRLTLASQVIQPKKTNVLVQILIESTSVCLAQNDWMELLSFPKDREPGHLVHRDVHHLPSRLLLGEALTGHVETIKYY